MLLKPMVPVSPVTLKENVVIAADWFVAIVTLDICELVTFPLIDRLTIEPLVVIARTDVGVGVSVGAGVAVGVSAGDNVGDGEGDGEGCLFW